MSPRQAVPLEHELDMDKEREELRHALLLARLFELEDDDVEVIPMPTIRFNRRRARRRTHAATNIDQLDWLGPLRHSFTSGVRAAGYFAGRVTQLFVLYGLQLSIMMALFLQRDICRLRSRLERQQQTWHRSLLLQLVEKLEGVMRHSGQLLLGVLLWHCRRWSDWSGSVQQAVRVWTGLEAGELWFSQSHSEVF